MNMVNVDWNRAFSALVAFLYLIMALATGGGEILLRIAIFLVFPMAGIWFSEELATTIRTTTTTEPPAQIVRFTAWILLFAPLVAVIIYRITR
jgi:hypothetical protein